MKKVGLTGGIGSGKTVVSEIFSALGVPVFNADFHAKKILESDGEVREELLSLFGEKIIGQGMVDRKAIGQIVFSNPEKLQLLNAIIHPRVFQSFEDWCSNNNSYPYVVKEAAILFESGADKGMDAFVVVTAPIELRISRVVSRDGITEEQVMQRISKQWKEQELLKRANFVIHNDGEQLLIPQVVSIHEQLNK